jgi:glycosidase
MVTQVRSKTLTGLVFVLVLSLLGQEAVAADFTNLASKVLRQGTSNESIYFIMVDRFENGDPANDNAGFIAGDPTGGFDPTDPGYWHGGDLKGVTKHLDYVKAMGFTAVWITPPVKQKYVQGSSAGYHGYWGLDFTTVDPHLGSEADLQEMVGRAHDLGLKVIIDVVANHTADVIYYDGSKPKILSSEANSKKPEWLNDINNYHNLGNSQGITGDFFGLDDLATENPEVIAGWIEVWTEWINKYDIDGFRIDTFKHVNPEFWIQVIPEIKSAALKKGKTDFAIFGEVFEPSPYVTSTYIRTKQIDSLLDFPFQDRVSRFAEYGGNTDELAALFNADDLYTTPTTNAYGLITFMGNHDMGRIGYQIRNAVLDSDLTGALERAKLANALLLLLRGSPTLYYGDEKGMAGVGGDKQARQSMFPTQIPAWQNQARIGADPIGTASSFAQVHPLEIQIQELQTLIAKHPALRDGTQQVRTNIGNVFVVTRFANNQEYFLAFNGSDESASSKFSVATTGSTWEALNGNCTLTLAMEITVPARDYCVYKAGKKYLAPKELTVQISLKNRDSLFQDGIALTATVPGGGYNTVAFSYRKKGGKWNPVGTAEKRTVKDSATKAGFYRAYLLKHGLKAGTEVEVIAVARNTSGKIAASKILKVKI